ncbi:Mitochondrial import receptor subunit tom20 [Zancudomyces culisetae]|uniref:Mitochondrial import receptor subunit tom20 n=1 Tax=Zancudomyces culisetae TaxID=1213189 RepID=A0A1R1PY30_ZANCU|nr:Mitochondrial import receptor subunit tom20 [Zancudomyces culisetae]|eukprot:OMH85827.1 Mitochondrial import receptor subunit tom20 [Zancudomyces culisetae]
MEGLDVPQRPEEREAYFMKEVSAGEAVCAQGEKGYEQAAKHFYHALKVYPNPIELVLIYQRTIPEQLFTIIMAMMAQEVKIKKEKYYEVFPPSDMNVYVKDFNAKNKTSAAEGKKKKKDTKEEEPTQEVEEVKKGAFLFAGKDFKQGDVIYTEECVVSSLLPGVDAASFCAGCATVLVTKEQVAIEDKVKEVEKEEVSEETLEKDGEKIEEVQETEAVIKGEKLQQLKKDQEKYDNQTQCPVCKEVFYCSSKCRDEHYPQIHQYVCTGGESSDESRPEKKFAQLLSSNNTIIPYLVGMFFGTLLDIETTKEKSLAMGVSTPTNKLSYLSTGNKSLDFTVWEHLERLSSSEKSSDSASDAEALSLINALFGSKIAGLSEFVNLERYVMIKEKLAANCFAFSTNLAESSDSEKSETSVAKICDSFKSLESSGSSANAVALYIVSSYISSASEAKVPSNVDFKFLDGNTKLSLVAKSDISKDDQLFVGIV